MIFFFFYIKCRFCLSVVLCFETSSLLLNCCTLYILFVFLKMFYLSALSHVALGFCFVSCSFFPSFFYFCPVKLPEKQFYSMNIKSRLEDSINLFHYLENVCVFYEHFVKARVCLCACLFNYRPPMLRKYVPWYCQGLSKTSTAVCVCVCMGGDLQLGRHNNSMCIWMATPLMLSIIAFSSKLHENAQNRMFSFCFTGHVVTVLEQLQRSSRKLPVRKSLADVCLCLCVQQFHSTINDVGGMVAQWLVLLPPKSLHVSHRQAHQVEWRLWMCMTKTIKDIYLPFMSQACDVLRIPQGASSSEAGLFC